MDEEQKKCDCQEDCECKCDNCDCDCCEKKGGENEEGEAGVE